MTLAELKQERAEVKAAIDTINTSHQEYQTPAGASYTRGSLATYYRRLDELDKRIAVASGAWGSSSPVFGGRR